MRFVRLLKWPILLIGSILVVTFLHYYLPSKDVVRIVGVDVKRMDVTSREFVREGEGAPAQQTRDVRFINAIWPTGKPRVYRNEDTGWGFPWYFKFDSGNLQAEAQDAALGQSAGPRWYVVSHYGWRIEIFSMFPNAVSIKPAPGPDYSPIPWFNIVFLGMLALLFFTIWRFVVRFRQRHIDPVFDELQENFDETSEDIRSGMIGLYDRWQRWLDTWRPKDRRRR